MSTVDDMDEKMEKLRQEVAVIIRILEEAGVEFNRDDDGRVIGVVVEARATIETKSGVMA